LHSIDSFSQIITGVNMSVSYNRWCNGIRHLKWCTSVSTYSATWFYENDSIIFYSLQKHWLLWIHW